MYKQGVELVLREYPGIILLGGQLGYEGLLEHLSELKPDVLLTNNYLFDDTRTTEMAEKLPEIRKAFPDLKIVMLTMAADPDLQHSLKDARLIDGFLLKASGGGEIYEALKMVCSGNDYWYY